MIVPVGERYQQIAVPVRKARTASCTKAALLPTLFVPMTGKAEDGREVQPDPSSPTIANGGFEEFTTCRRPTPSADGPSAARRRPNPRTAADARRLVLPAAARSWSKTHDAPEGKHYVTFSNIPSRAAAPRRCKAWPSTAARCSELNVSLWVKAKNIRAGHERRAAAGAGHHLLRREPRPDRLHLGRTVARYVRLAAGDRQDARAAQGPRGHRAHRPERCDRRNLVRRHPHRSCAPR